MTEKDSPPRYNDTKSESSASSASMMVRLIHRSSGKINNDGGNMSMGTADSDIIQETTTLSLSR